MPDHMKTIVLSRTPAPRYLGKAGIAAWRRLAPLADKAVRRKLGTGVLPLEAVGFSALCRVVSVAETNQAPELRRAALELAAQFFLPPSVIRRRVR
jgi:hypothetical protein